MTAYFETSAFAKLLISEPGSDLAREVWSDAFAVACVHIGFVELHSALGSALRSRRFTKGQILAAAADIERLRGRCAVIKVDDELVRSAASIARAHAVAGYDAVHLAAAESLGRSALMVTWDRRIAAAALDRGLDVAGAAP